MIYSPKSFANDRNPIISPSHLNRFISTAYAIRQSKMQKTKALPKQCFMVETRGLEPMTSRV